MAKVKKWQHQRLTRMWRNGIPHIWLVWYNYCGKEQQCLTGPNVRPSTYPPRNLFQRNETGSHRNLSTRIHSNFIHNTQNLWMVISRCPPAGEHMSTPWPPFGNADTCKHLVGVSREHCWVKKPTLQTTWQTWGPHQWWPVVTAGGGQRRWARLEKGIFLYPDCGSGDRNLYL